MTKDFKFKGALWLYEGKGGWHFVTVPKRTSQSIRTYVCDESSAWGSVRVCVTVTDFAWNTSIFPDSKSGCYFLPVKKEVRRKLMLNAGDKVFGTLTIELNLDHEFD